MSEPAPGWWRARTPKIAATVHCSNQGASPRRRVSIHSAARRVAFAQLRGHRREVEAAGLEQDQQVEDQVGGLVA